MKKNKYSTKKKVFSTIAILLLIFLGVVNTNSYIKKYSWKSNSPDKITDFMEFNNQFNITGRKIVFKNQKYGTIILCLHKYLLVTNKEGSLCLYSNKGELGNN